MMRCNLPRRALVTAGARLAWALAAAGAGTGAASGVELPAAAEPTGQRPPVPEGPGLSLQVSPYPLLFLPVRIDGADALALLDSGSATTLRLSDRLVARLGLTPVPVPDTQIRGLDGRAIPLTRVRITELSVDGRQRMSGLEAEVAGTRIEAIAAQVGTAFDAVLGWGWLRRQPFLLDLGARRLLLAPDLPAPRPVQVAWPFAETLGLPLLEARCGGRPVRLLLDTGAPMCNIDSAFSQARPGEVIERELALGDWRSTVAWRVKDLAVQRRALASDGTLGLNLLQRFTLRVDPGHARLALH